MQHRQLRSLAQTSLNQRLARLSKNLWQRFANARGLKDEVWESERMNDNKIVKNNVVKLGKSAGSKGRIIYGVPADATQVPDEYKNCECFFRTDKNGVFLTHMDNMKLLYIQDKGIVCGV